MKREIKFRAWDKKHNCWDDDFAIHADGCLYQPAKARWDISDIAVETAYDELEIMQFTGLKDKNDKEIYDSDILRIQYFKIVGGKNLGVSEVDAELVGVVEITPLALVLKNIIGEKWCEYTGYEQGEGYCKVFHLHDVYEGSSDAEYQIEVIGNIYSNPELL